MWWQFKAGFARKLGFILAGMLVAFLLGHHAHAQGTSCYIWQTNDGTSESPEAEAAAEVAAQSESGDNTFQMSSDTCTTPPTGPGQTCRILEQVTSCNATCRANGGEGTTVYANAIVVYGGSVGGPCPANCNNLPNMSILAAIAGNTGTTPGALCVNGCTYTNGASTLVIGGAQASLEGQAVSSGAACSPPGDGTTAGVPGNCMSVNGTVSCANSSGNATVNNDAITAPVAPTAANTRCSSYADGAVACVNPSSGTPNSGAPTDASGNPDVPAVVVSDAQGTVSYYSAAQVASSHTPVATVSNDTGGNPSGTTGANGSGFGTTGTGTGAGVTGDCPPGQTCTGTTDAISGGDDCVTPPACTDTDPVNCGVARQIWLVRCQSIVPVAESDIASAIATMGGPVGTVPSSTVDVSTVVSTSGSPDFGAVTMSGTASCPSPISVTIAGRAMSFDLFAHVCEFASQISYIILTIAYMIAARVMFTGAVSNSF